MLPSAFASLLSDPKGRPEAVPSSRGSFVTALEMGVFFLTLSNKTIP